MTQTSPALTLEAARRALEEACAVAHLDCQDATLVRMGENAMFRLPNDVMARVARSLETSGKEVRVAAWLAEEKFPAARPVASRRQPISATGLSVTFWEFIHESVIPIKDADLGVVLRKLHDLPPPENLNLPRFQPMPNLVNRLDNAIGIPGSEIAYLRQRGQELERRFSELEFVLPEGPIHGDAHNGNLMRDQDGTIRLIDFENFSWGPREWDVSVAAIRYKAFGWLDKKSYDSYVKAYGFDPLAWLGFPVLRAIRELNMTTWLMQRMGESKEIDGEISRRIADLRDEESPRRWRAY